ncbi:hypothetical protein SO802_004803 [Lithocarpus litseifolius]|uniref:Uncharacterized protein n=1 Tax=Lithocarpus litseifolius TaxID=425828 RepID=A0AAW2DK45_9ROSI
MGGKKNKYYIKCRVPAVRLISCLPNFSKGMDEDFPIVSGDWHDGLYYPTQEGEPEKYHIALTKHLVNFTDLNQILRSEIFLHKDGQLRVAHVILGYKPFTKRFQSLKNVIKARDARLALIDVAAPSFLLTKPPPMGTQDALLPAPFVARLLYSQEPPIPLDDEVKEPTPDPVQQEVTDKDFEVFYQ